SLFISALLFHYSISRPSMASTLFSYTTLFRSFDRAGLVLRCSFRGCDFRHRLRRLLACAQAACQPYHEYCPDHVAHGASPFVPRSEERRVGKEGRSRGSARRSKTERRGCERRM